jgi:A/G-specific adenine glycosylase
MLSEFMLQQTRVDTVLEYFDRFTRRWPELADLASSDEEEVVLAWAGLGYYSRARNLHRCAVAAYEGGGLPNSVSELRKLPGIGPYTAGAIASIGFQTPTPVVDGNVERVLSRVDAIHGNPRSSAGRKVLWARAESLLHPDRPGDFNQALMELGALICTPRNPKCTECPWQDRCLAHQQGIEAALPEIPKKTPPSKIYGTYGLLRIDGKLVIGKRPLRGILAGMWEPIGSDWTREDHREDTAALVEAVNLRAGLEVEVIRSLGDVVHVFSHRRLRARVYALRLLDSTDAPRTGSYYSEVGYTNDLPALAMSKLARKLIELGDRAGLCPN